GYDLSLATLIHCTIDLFYLPITIPTTDNNKLLIPLPFPPAEPNAEKSEQLNSPHHLSFLSTTGPPPPNQKLSAARVTARVPSSTPD
ncbi:unnamed protein product, partial [Linum tenue]